MGTAWSMPPLVHSGASLVKNWGRGRENSAGSPANAWLCPCEKDPAFTHKQDKLNEKHGECEYRPLSCLLGTTAALNSMVINLSTATRTGGWHKVVLLGRGGQCCYHWVSGARHGVEAYCSASAL